MFNNLSKIELFLLSIYTLFNPVGPEGKKVKEVMEKILGTTFNDLKTYANVMMEKELLTTSGFNWRTNSFDYQVNPKHMVEAMLFLYQKQSDIVVQVLKTVKNTLQPKYTQKMLWEFIISNFEKIDIQTFDDNALESDLQILTTIADDWRFMPIINMLEPSTFYLLYQEFLTQTLENGKIINATFTRQTIEQYKAKNDDVMKTRLICLLDLYEYLAEGKMPKQLLANNKNHFLIAAIAEAYAGKCSNAMNHMKKALALHTKSHSFYRTPKSYLAVSIVNFFYVLIAYKSNTDDAKKKSIALTRYAGIKETQAAKVLHDLLYNNSTEKQMNIALETLCTSENHIDFILAQLMRHFLGKPVAEQQPLQWLILKHEFSRYIPLDDDTKAKAEKAYGSQTLLTSIYRKQEWENVLEDLMMLGSGAKGVENKKEARIGYILHSINDDYVTVRQQTLLKNGTWGAGKSVSMAAFFSGEVEGMTVEDANIAKLTMREMSYSGKAKLKHVLPLMVEESRLYVGRYAPFTLVDVTEEMPYLTLHHTANGFNISSNVPARQIDHSIIVTHRGAASINFIHMTEDQRPYYKRLLSVGHFPLEAEEQLKAFLKSVGGKIEVNSDLVEGGSTLPVVEGNPQLILQMRPQDREYYIVSLFTRPLEEGRIRCVPASGNEIIIDGIATQRTRVKRNMEKENDNLDHFIKALIDEIPEIGLITSSQESGTLAVPYYDLLPIIEYAQQNPDRISCEWPEGAQMKIKQKSQSSGWSGAIKKTENGWFEIEGSIELDQDKVVTMAELMDLIGQSHGRFIKLGDGEFLALSDTLRRQLNQLGAIASRTKGKLQISPFSAAVIGSEILDGELFLSEDDELKKIRQRIKEASTYSPHVPKTLNATLRQYQKDGYQWMMRLNKWGAGALLADDMGLGKTIQTITFLLAKANEGPALVIAPASVAPNWKTEFEKFAPSLHVTMLNFVGDRADAIEFAKKGDVIVTTYGLLLSVKDEITKKHWATICLDEAHIIKNRGAKTSAVAMQLQSDNRIMLTGTPVQNHLGELWNLFQFVNPGLLGSFEDFNRRFIIPIEQNKDEERQHDLDRLVKPFMLRRTKDKVAKELPEKEEIYQHVTLTEEEQLVYEAMRQKAEAMLLEEGAQKVSVNTLAEITRLRQCACDVRLIEPNEKEVGSKIKALTELIGTILEGFSSQVGIQEAEKGGVLVFSQFTSYLALVQKALNEADIPFLYIDGSVSIKNRTQLVEKFQKGECPVFLISLKAGGLGLNLTRANYVIHMDPWWNPAIEAQATDRAHRIGQKQHVTVYHLIAEGTIEEKIQRLHNSKRALADSILNATDASYKLTGEQLLEMVSGK